MASPSVFLDARYPMVDASGVTAKAAEHYYIRTNAALPVMTKIDAPTVTTTVTSIEAAELLGGISQKTPSAAQNLQFPTGTALSTACGANLAVGDSFEIVIINLGGTGDVVTATVNTGVTFVGDVAIQAVADTATLGVSSATFRVRNTAANTWVVYRV